MDVLDQIEHEIKGCHFQLKPVEFMRWGHEDLQQALQSVLGEPEFAAGMAVHCKISCASLFKQGPLYNSIKSICPDFVLTDNGRHAVAMIDYQGAGYDHSFDAIKRAICQKTGLAYMQVPQHWSIADLRQLLLAELAGHIKTSSPPQDAKALQARLTQHDFNQVTRAA